jgi:hypothetical protein
MKLTNNTVIQVRRGYSGVGAYILKPGGAVYPLRHIVRHSRTGFEYGYGGSGPADLALSILAACVSMEKADRWYGKFKIERVAAETAREWTVKVQQVREWVKQQEAMLSRLAAAGVSLQGGTHDAATT